MSAPSTKPGSVEAARAALRKTLHAWRDAHDPEDVALSPDIDALIAAARAEGHAAGRAEIKDEAVAACADIAEQPTAASAREVLRRIRALPTVKP